MKQIFPKNSANLNLMLSGLLLLSFMTIGYSLSEIMNVRPSTMLAQTEGATDGGTTETQTGTQTQTTPPPSAPSVLHATPNMCGSGVIYLSWPSSSGATGYRLSRDGAVIFDANGASHPDSGLTAGSSHNYSIVAYNTGGDSSPATVSATAPPACSQVTIPVAPSNLMVDGTPAAGSVHLHWTDNSTNEDKFNIERKITTDTGYAYTVWQVGTDITSYTDTSAAVNTTYDYRVQACLSGSGCSAYTNLYGIIIPSGGGGGGGGGTTQTSAPTAPTGLTASSGTCGITSISLAWQAVSNATGYKIFKSGTLIYTTTNLGYMDTGLPMGTTQTYTVNAFNGMGMSPGATVTGTTPPACQGSGTTSSVPTVPSGLVLAAAPTATSITIRWTDNSTNEDKFNIERKLSTASTYSFLSQVGTNMYYYTDNSVTSGASYDYRVQACLSGTGCSDYTYLTGVNTASTYSGTQTQGGGGGGNTSQYSYNNTMPLVPSNFHATVASICGVNPVTLSWLLSSYATSYKIYRNGTYLASVTTVNYIDSTAALTSNYTYTLYAANSYGTSTGVVATVSTPAPCNGTNNNYTSTTTSTSTIPVAPSNLSLNGLPTANSISLRWTDNSNNEDKFNLVRKLSTATMFSFLYQITGANVTTYVDNTVSPGVSYDYGVQACRSGVGCSPYAYLSGVNTHSTVVTASTTYTNTNNTVNTTNTNTASSTANYHNAYSSTTASTTDYANTYSRLGSTTPARLQASTSVEATKMQDISEVIDTTKVAIEKVKQGLVRMVDEHIRATLKNTDPTQLASTTMTFAAIRANLVAKIDSRLSGLTTINSTDINALSQELIDGLKKIHGKVVVATNATSTIPAIDTKGIYENLDQLNGTLKVQAQALKATGGDLLYKDTNHDGISDYDSTHIYNIDPVKPSPVSTIGTTTLTAGQKVLLGYDPKQKDLVKVTPEQPTTVVAPVTSVYKVADVKLTTDKKVAIKGTALPNSYVTVYIYSTPVIVTVKANSDGEWQYTLDKELDSGQHTIYTATVNNTGKIVAKSTPFLFTATAQAATLDVVPPSTVSNVAPRGLLDNIQLYVLIGLIILLAVVILIIVGKGSKETVVQG